MVQLYAIVPVGKLDVPVDPGYGRPGYGGGHPDHTLPGGGAHPGHDLPWAPARPGHELPGGGPVDPGYGRPGGGLVDPGYGRPEGGGGMRPDHSLPEGPPAHPWLPGFLTQRPDNSLPLPPVEGVPPPTKPLPPGTIWPPLPPSVPAGTHAVLVWISGLGYKYAVVQVPETKPVDPAVPPAPAPT